MSTPIAFVDCETTGLNPDKHHLWELAVIRRQYGVDVEYLWQVRPDMSTADPQALAISRFEERFAVPDGCDVLEFVPSDPPLTLKLTLREFLFDLPATLKDAVVVGSNPGFDVAFLTRLLRANGRKLPWHYRPVDIATMAAVHIGPEAAGPLPWSSRAVSRAVGVEPPGDDVAHTALGDARWARDVFDAVLGGTAAGMREALEAAGITQPAARPRRPRKGAGRG